MTGRCGSPAWFFRCLRVMACSGDGMENVTSSPCLRVAKLLSRCCLWGVSLASVVHHVPADRSCPQQRCRQPPTRPGSARRGGSTMSDVAFKARRPRRHKIGAIRPVVSGVCAPTLPRSRQSQWHGGRSVPPGPVSNLCDTLGWMRGVLVRRCRVVPDEVQSLVTVEGATCTQTPRRDTRSG